MLPYGVIIRENRLTMQQAFMVWQRKFGYLKPTTFISCTILPLIVLVAIYIVGSLFLDKESSIEVSLVSGVLYAILLAAYMYTTVIKTVKDFTVTSRDRRVQLVLKEEAIEIVTDFSKETVFYDEIDLCYEKNFLVTLIFDKGNFPLSISKMHFERGDYDTFVEILRNKLPGKYEKKGEN